SEARVCHRAGPCIRTQGQDTQYACRWPPPHEWCQVAQGSRGQALLLTRNSCSRSAMIPTYGDFAHLELNAAQVGAVSASNLSLSDLVTGEAAIYHRAKHVC